MSAKTRKAHEASPKVRMVGVRPLHGGGWRLVTIDLPEAMLIERGASTYDDLRGNVLGRAETILGDSELAAQLYETPPPEPAPQRIRVRGVDFVVREAQGGTWAAFGQVSYGRFDPDVLHRATERGDVDMQRQQREARDGVEVIAHAARTGPYTDAVRDELVSALEEAFASRPWPYDERRDHARVS